MKKHELLKIMDDALLEKLFGYCYPRTRDSYEAQELCSDIVYALMKAAHSDGEIQNIDPFVWRTARNVYADFCSRRRQYSERFYEGDADEVWQSLADTREEDADGELLAAVYRQISFLTRTYRKIMILFYLDGLSTAEIAVRLGISETAVRQRLFSARKKVRSEVEEMNETGTKPMVLDQLEYAFWGEGDPEWGDPRNVCTRQFSRHIVWLCRKKPMSAAEIAAELNVPTVYVEEELDILASGENGQYGLLRKMNQGKYGINFILFDQKTIHEAQTIYEEQIPNICRVLLDFITGNKDAYLSFPYLNRQANLNLILWQQLWIMAGAFENQVETILNDQYFAGTGRTDRPYSVYAYVKNIAGTYCGRGLDGIEAENICGYSRVEAANLYCSFIRRHFQCGWNLAMDPQLQLALRAIYGIRSLSLTEREKEYAAKAVESGYLYRDGDMLYTKILVNEWKDRNRVFEISRKLRKGYFDQEANDTARKVAELIRRKVPSHLMKEWVYANRLASLTVFEKVAEELIRKGVLTAPEGGIGAEGCWMSVDGGQAILGNVR